MIYQALFCCHCGAVINISLKTLEEYNVGETFGPSSCRVLDPLVLCCNEPDIVYRSMSAVRPFKYDSLEDGVELKDDEISDVMDAKVDRFDFVLEEP